MIQQRNVLGCEQFNTKQEGKACVMPHDTSLASLGWQAFFQQQCSEEACDKTVPARLIEHDRTSITVTTGSEVLTMTLLSSMPDMVVGDWILLDQEKQFLRLLDRKTCFSRKAAGSKLKKQLIAANVDIAFIMFSMNQDFNLNRIERFLALVNESGAESVILLSKCDQAIEPEKFVADAQALDSHLVVKAINCLDIESRAILSPWLNEGKTIAMLGSSGVGKSTLINTLLGEDRQSTGEIRDNDKKGRHTTTRRSLIALGTGGLILDAPGIREIQLTDCKEGIAATFSDIEVYAKQCRFIDCQHQVEPGCAVQQAIKSGDLDQRRFTNYFKLLREEAFNTSSFSERRANKKDLSKHYKRAQTQAKGKKGK